MSIREIRDNPKRLDAMSTTTTYNNFNTSNDYNSGYKSNAKMKYKDAKLKNNSRIDVKVRKKVKTAGNKDKDNIFNTTFGSFDHGSYFNYTNDMQKVQQVALNFVENNPFEFSYEDNNTPTLPNVELQASYKDRQHLAKITKKPGGEYEFQGAHQKAKSSCSLRKKSHGGNKNTFFTNDKNFK